MDGELPDYAARSGRGTDSRRRRRSGYRSRTIGRCVVHLCHQVYRRHKLDSGHRAARAVGVGDRLQCPPDHQSSRPHHRRYHLRLFWAIRAAGRSVRPWAAESVHRRARCDFLCVCAVASIYSTDTESLSVSGTDHSSCRRSEYGRYTVVYTWDSGPPTTGYHAGLDHRTGSRRVGCTLSIRFPADSSRRSETGFSAR
ncbi:MAG: hypothetical protein J07HN6_00789 [Halonotius sp. J07HN6]|nr:MAG: hypothetical protein J07HN6_00789 [Halonotius sp. J07HN6]